MIIKRLRQRVLMATSAGAIAALVLGGSTSVVHAQATHDAPATLEALKTNANVDITARITQLDVLIGRISVASPDCGTNETITTQFTIAKSGLTTLNTQIQALTKVADGRGLFTSTYKDFRVYALQTPKTNIAAACSALLGVDASLKQVSTKLQAFADGLTAAGKDPSSAQVLLDAANAKIDLGHDAAISTVSTADLVPDAGDAAVYAANNAALKAAHQSLKVSAQSYRAARTELQQTLASLKLAAA